MQDLSSAPARPAVTQTPLQNRPAAEPARPNTGRNARKAELLLEATRNFCGISRPSAKEISVYREFFYRLIGGCGKADMRTLSAALAPNPYAPRPVVLYLALDEIEIAAPILLLSPVLGEIDIVELARRQSPAHLEVLCRRDGLTPAAIVALLARGGENAAKLLSRNGYSAKSLVETTTDEAKQAVGGQTTGETAKETVAESSDRQASVLATGGVRRELLDLAAKGGRLGRANTLQQPSTSLERDAGLAGRLIEAARSGNKKQVAAEMARKAGCSSSTIEELITRDSLEPICVLMKGLRIDDLSASQLILLLKPAIGRSREEAARAARLYRRLNGESCRQFVETLGNLASEKHPDAIAMTAQNTLAGAISERRREIAMRSPARPEARPATPGTAGRPFGKAGIGG